MRVKYTMQFLMLIATAFPIAPMMTQQAHFQAFATFPTSASCLIRWMPHIKNGQFVTSALSRRGGGEEEKKEGGITRFLATVMAGAPGPTRRDALGLPVGGDPSTRIPNLLLPPLAFGKSNMDPPRTFTMHAAQQQPTDSSM